MLNNTIISRKRNTDGWLGPFLSGVKESPWTKRYLHVFVVHQSDWFIPGGYEIIAGQASSLVKPLTMFESLAALGGRDL